MDRLRVGELIYILNDYPKDTEIRFITDSIDIEDDDLYQELSWIYDESDGNKCNMLLDISEIKEKIEEKFESKIERLESENWDLESKIESLKSGI